MKKVYIIYWIIVFIVIELIFFIGYKNIVHFDKLLENQKQLFEILILLIWLISGKLIIETIDYVKESRIKNLKETFNLILDYDKKIEDLLNAIISLDKVKKTSDFEELWKSLVESYGMIKILLLIETIDQIINNSFWDKNYKIFQIHLEHIYLKVYSSLWFKKYLIRDKITQKVIFPPGISNRWRLQGDNSEFVDKFLEKCNTYIDTSR